MKIAMVVAGVVVLLVLIVVGVGYMLPQNHQASREQAYSADPARVFATITTPSIPRGVPA